MLIFSSGHFVQYWEPHYNKERKPLIWKIKKEKTIVIFTASRARQLLKAGFQIIDIKPDRKDKTHMRSVFIFRYDERIQQYLKEM